MKAHGLLSALAAAGVAGAAYERAYRPWQLAWAATPEEAGRGHPGDGIVSNATFDATRAIAVQNSRRRQPVWSGYLTRPMARWMPACWRSQALDAIKGIHTMIFFSVFAAVMLTLWDGVRGGPGRRTVIAGGVVLAESALYVSNNQVCPLTPLAEEFAAERGSVVDMFLPASLARQIPLVASSAAVLALVLNLRALLTR